MRKLVLVSLCLLACGEDPIEDCADACPLGQACSVGDCVPAACDETTLCPPGLECSGGRCGLPPPDCLSDDDCPDGRCVDGECFANTCADGETRTCETECGEGEQACDNGVWRPCPVRAPREVEICDDQVDDDCDGVVDEGCVGCEDGDERVCETACGAGTETCRFEAWMGCDAPRPGLETCDGALDEDCDGAVDEGCDDCADGARRPCETECGVGEETCMDNLWIDCSAPARVDGACPMTAPECALEDRFEAGEVRLSDRVGRASFPRPIWTGTSFGVVWTDRREDASRTLFRRVSGLGQPQSEAAEVAPRSVSHAVWNGQGFHVAGVSLSRLGVATLSGLGSVVRDTGSLEIRGSQPVIQRSGENVLLVYSFEEDLWSARVTQAGEAVGPPTRLTNAPGRSMDLSITETDEGYALTFWDERDNPEDPFSPHVYFMRLDQSGRKIGAEHRVGDGNNAKLVFNGGEFGVAYTLDRPEMPNAVAFQRLDALGDPVGDYAVISTTETNARDPALAWDGERWLLVWVELTGNESDLYGAAVGADGQRIGLPQQIVAAPGQSLSPELAWSGTRFALAWTDQRDREDGDVLMGVGPILCPE